MAPEKTIFEKIVTREIPAQIEYEDESCIALHDLNPQAPTHILIIPKKVIPRLSQAEEDDQLLLGHLLLIARQLAQKNNFAAGFRLVINNGPHGGESIPHLHLHLLAGRPMTWPPG